MITAAASAQHGQSSSADVNWLIEALELREGSIVADIGAGEGEYTLAIARHIGDDGMIYSTELGGESIQELRKEINEASASNVTVLEGHPERTNLPEESCHAIFLRRVYHHVEAPDAMNSSLFKSLKPGGRLAIIEFEPRGTEGEPGNRARGRQHGVTPATVIKELQKAGFTLISNEESSGRNYYVLLEKPEPR